MFAFRIIEINTAIMHLMVLYKTNIAMYFLSKHSIIPVTSIQFATVSEMNSWFRPSLFYEMGIAILGPLSILFLSPGLLLPISISLLHIFNVELKSHI